MRGIMRRDMKRELIDQFKANLTRLMGLRGTNPRALSEASGLGSTAVRDILEGKSTEPRYSTIRRLSGALQCQMTELVPDDPEWAPLPSHGAPPARQQPEQPEAPAITEETVRMAVIACDEAIATLGKFVPSERRALYVVRLCRWALKPSKDGKPVTLDGLRAAIDFLIHTDDAH
jgi:transcriptional regulator with XRE-family HTH domain